jgi:hypothetical protein
MILPKKVSSNFLQIFFLFLFLDFVWNIYEKVCSTFFYVSICFLEGESVITDQLVWAAVVSGDALIAWAWCAKSKREMTRGSQKLQTEKKHLVGDRPFAGLRTGDRKLDTPYL